MPPESVQPVLVVFHDQPRLDRLVGSGTEPRQGELLGGLVEAREIRALVVPAKLEVQPVAELALKLVEHVHEVALTVRIALQPFPSRKYLDVTVAELAQLAALPAQVGEGEEAVTADADGREM